MADGQPNIVALAGLSEGERPADPSDQKRGDRTMPTITNVEPLFLRYKFPSSIHQDDAINPLRVFGPKDYRYKGA